MIREFKPLGTILYGRAMAAQLVYELKLLGLKSPAILADQSDRRKAIKFGKFMTAGHYDSLPIYTDEVPSDCDCLLLAGGKGLSDRYRDDSRVRVLIPLNVEQLESIEEVDTEILVIDKALTGKLKNNSFFQKLIQSSASGLVHSAPAGEIPDSFTFHNRTTVISGDETLGKVPELLERIQVKKPLILTDQGIIGAGLLDRLRDVLGEREYSLFSEIPPDSNIEVVNAIGRFYGDETCDSIIALGGGSVLDTAKGVALNVSLQADDLKRYAGSGHIPHLNTPFIAIPTTSGTGSEMTNAAVISDPEKGRKLIFISDKMQPDFALLDSRLTTSLPSFLSSITGMDALTHAVEAYTCIGKNPLSDQLAWTAIELIRDHLIEALKNPGDLEHRRALALASNFAGLAFSNSMVGMVHTIGHSVGAICHVPHGSCMSVLLPHVLKFNFQAIEPLLAQLFGAVGGPKVFDETPAERRAEKTIEEIKKLNNKMRELTGGKHPVSLRNIVDREGNQLVREEHFPKIAETSMGDGSIIYNPVELRANDVLNVLRCAY